MPDPDGKHGEGDTAVRAPIEKIDLIGAPLDLGVRELGLKLGPDAFREAGLPEAARHVGLEIRDRGDIAVPAVNHAPGRRRGREFGAIAACCQDLARSVRESLAEGRVPVCLGGDHSLAIGSVARVKSCFDRIGCLWLDAHPDANTPETSPSGNVHGMPVAILLGYGPALLADVDQAGASVAPENFSILGTRDIDDGERTFLRRHGVQMFTVFDMIELGLPNIVAQCLQHLTDRTDGVHVSMDIDVLSEDIAPGVGLPSHCGLEMREAMYICRRIAADCRVLAVDMVGLNPVRDRGMKTAKRAVELLLALLGRSFDFNYDQYLRDQER